MKYQIVLMLAWTLSIAAQQRVYRGQPHNAGIPAKVDKDCKCWVEWYRRVPCSGGGYLSQSFCEAAGCCYFADKEHYSAHRCYQASGCCPSPECIVDVTKRKACESQNRYFVPQHLCATKGCCHSKFAKPNCYKGKAVAKPTPYSPPAPHPYFAQDRLKPHLFQKLDRLGPFHLVATCYLERKRCGGYGVRRDQCIRFGCCWQANENYGLIKAECFSAVRFWLDYPFGDATWNNWNNWTPCSGAPCVSGTRKRTRTCKGDYLPDKSCSGPTQEEEPCNGDCAGASWSQFVPGTCNSPEPACVSGQTVETRACFINGMPVADFNCAGLSTRTATCNGHLCSAYDTWTPFDGCSAECGAGVKRRTRTCTSPGTGVPPAECSRQEMSCNLGSCPVADWGPFTIGTTCASDEPTCLAGIRRDTRQCLLKGQVVDDSECTGVNSRDVSCNTNLCLVFDNWMPFSTCSLKCGSGMRERTRTCVLPGDQPSSPGCLEQTEICNRQDCEVADWGDFTIGTTCVSDEPTCLAGIRRDTRQCLLEGQVVDDSECSGLNFRDVSCNTNLCLVLDNWMPFSTCSLKCGSGVRERTRNCVLPGSQPSSPGCLEQTEICNPQDCPVADWGPFTIGTTCVSDEPTCLAGLRRDTRQCLLGGQVVEDSECTGMNFREVSCNTNLCLVFDNWMPFSPCSLKCGSGTRERTRTCASPGTDSTSPGCLQQMATCNSQDCPDWGPFTIGTTCVSDEPECLAGIRTDTRQCLLGGQVVADSECTGVNFRKVSCNTNLCSLFGTWTDWTTCDQPCGDGNRQRIRVCDSPGTELPANQCIFQSETCNLGSCNVAVDVIFLLDGSLPVVSNEFAAQRAWLQNFVTLLDISSTSQNSRDRVGVIRYDDDAITQFIPTSRDIFGLQISISVIRQRPNSRRSAIAAAINQAVMFDFPLDRPASKKVLVLLASGSATDLQNIPAAIAAADAANVERYAVGLLGTDNTALLTQIVGGDPARVLRESNINNLSVINTALLNLIYS